MKKIALGRYVVIFLSLLISAPASAQEKTLKEALTGGWSLAWVELRRMSDFKSFGPSNKGAIILQGNGRFAFIILAGQEGSSQDETVSTAKEAMREGGLGDLAIAIARGSLSYFGTYTLNEYPGRQPWIRFAVEASNYPLNGENQYYFVKAIEGMSLLLSLFPRPAAVRR